MIAKLHSVGSSANNHLIGEMAGLFTSAVEWPWFNESPAWMLLAQRSLEAESARQFYASGVNREQAFGYHLFAMELLLLAALEGERAGRPFSHPYRSRLRSGVRAAAAQIGPHGLLANLWRLRRRSSHRPPPQWQPGTRPDRRRHIGMGARCRVRHPVVARIPSRGKDPAVGCAHS